LLSDGLVVREGDELHLCEAYEQAVKRARNDKRNDNEPINDTNEPINDLLAHIDKSFENKDVKSLNELVKWANDTINDTLNEPINEPINEKHLLLVAKVASQPGMKRIGLSEELNISIGSIKRFLNEISTPPCNLIEYRGPKKSGGYYLTAFGMKILNEVASKL
jgi:hypothetical protein